MIHLTFVFLDTNHMGNKHVLNKTSALVIVKEERGGKEQEKTTTGTKFLASNKCYGDLNHMGGYLNFIRWSQGKVESFQHVGWIHTCRTNPCFHLDHFSQETMYYTIHADSIGRSSDSTTSRM